MISSSLTFDEMAKRHRVANVIKAVKARKKKYRCRCQRCTAYNILQTILSGKHTLGKMHRATTLHYSFFKQHMTILESAGLVYKRFDYDVYTNVYYPTEKGMRLVQLTDNLRKMINDDDGACTRSGRYSHNNMER